MMFLASESSIWTARVRLPRCTNLEKLALLAREDDEG